MPNATRRSRARPLVCATAAPWIFWKVRGTRRADVGQISAIRIMTPSGKDLRRSIDGNERTQYQPDEKIKAQPWMKTMNKEQWKWEEV